ncbi:uncharacterized protein METZ01_LOCUS354568, partial [marine metagenome]
MTTVFFIFIYKLDYSYFIIFIYLLIQLIL